MAKPKEGYKRFVTPVTIVMAGAKKGERKEIPAGEEVELPIEEADRILAMNRQPEGAAPKPMPNAKTDGDTVDQASRDGLLELQGRVEVLEEQVADLLKAADDESDATPSAEPAKAETTSGAA